MLTDDERMVRKRAMSDFPWYAPRVLKIRSKAGRVEPLKLNHAQLVLHDALEAQRASTGRVRALVLKGRQQGVSTYVAGRYYWRVTHQIGYRVYVLTHEAEATDNLFTIAKRYHDQAPPWLRPRVGADSRRELEFPDLDAGYKVGTAGNRGAGRSSTVQLFHGCLGLETSVVTSSGALVRVSDVKVGDLLVTHTGKRAAVSYVSEQSKPVTEVILHGLRQVPLVATDEHRFWTRTGWAELKDIEPGDVIGYPIREIQPVVRTVPFRLPDAPRPQGGGRREVGPDSVELTYELGRLLGLYLAEGSIAYQRKAPHSPANVTLVVHERDAARTLAWADPVRACFTTAKHATRRDSKTNTVTLYGRSFAAFVERMCGVKDSKRFPEEWWRMPREFVEGLCIGYLAGDGHSSKREHDRRISISSVRSATVVVLRDALATLGYGWACLSYREGAIRHGRNERAQWTLRLSGPGVDPLCEKLGWQMPPRRRTGHCAVEIRNGYAWVPVLSKTPLGVQPVRDFEIDDPDHSYCTPHGASHNSEVAFWPHAAEHARGVLQAVPDAPGTEVILESTANGVGNYFHEQWQAAEAGQSEFIAVFLPWFWQPEYRRPLPDGFRLTDEEAALARMYSLDDEQIAWRRAKIVELSAGGADGLLGFKQEYPCNAAEAFISSGGEYAFIRPELVMPARKPASPVEPFGALVVGVDPARFGDDRTGIIRRRGRVAFGAEAHVKLDTMSVTGRIVKIIREERPSRVFVDVGGLGAGIVDRLRELGLGDLVVAVNSAEKPLDQDRYVNRRAEMWGEMRAWLDDGPVQIPDRDDLHADLCGPMHSYDSKGRIQLEKKEDMKRRGIRSPDLGDALALTFSTAVPMDERVRVELEDLPTY